jgi:hypothetical protein
MITVLPGKPFVFKNPNADHFQRQKLIDEATRLIMASSPFVDSIRFINNTKSCQLDVAFNKGEITVTVTNPADQLFDLNELENPVTPIQITGR